MDILNASFEHVLIDGDNPPDPHCKGAGDLDGDGFPDLLAASASGGGLFWYRYPGWSKHQIADGSFTTDMAVADMDGDGCLDVVIPNDDGLMLYRNPRGQGGDPTGLWAGTNIGAAGARMHNVVVADLDGDGQPEIVTRGQSGFGKLLGNQIHIWRQEVSQRWAHRTFACPHGEGLAVADMDGDGRPDVVIGGRWYRNPGDITTGDWAEQLYMPAQAFERNWTHGDVMVAVGDLDGDARPEIVLAPSEGRGRLSWFKAPVDPMRPTWEERVIETWLDHAHGLALGDLNLDKQLDIVLAKMHQAVPPQEVCVYFNRDKGRAWLKHVVATTGSHNIVLVDVGRDGRPDIYGANWNNQSATGGAIELWLNRI